MSLRTRSALLVAAILTLAACGDAGSGTTSSAGGSGSAASSSGAATQSGTSAEGASVTIYSGRNEALVGPLLEQLEAATGTEVEVRYGDTAALAAQVLEEGDRSPADVFFSQDAGALGAVAKAGMFAQLDPAITGSALKGYADAQGRWVATSARARVVAYHPEAAPEAEDFTTIDQVLDPAYRGQVGFAPTNASFHSFVTALRVAKGEDGARDWLTRFKANQPQAYEKNGAVLAAVDSGEVSLGLINHYYWHELVAEKGADAVNAKIRFLGADDPGALINVAGAGVLEASDAKAAASKVVEYLLSKPAQQYFADETAEYPVVAGVSTTKHELPPLAELTGSTVDLGSLDSLEATLAMLDEVGLT